MERVMRYIGDDRMRDLAIYRDESPDGRLVMLVFNKDNIIAQGTLDDKYRPEHFILRVAMADSVATPDPPAEVGG